MRGQRAPDEMRLECTLVTRVRSDAATALFGNIRFALTTRCIIPGIYGN